MSGIFVVIGAELYMFSWTEYFSRPPALKGYLQLSALEPVAAAALPFDAEQVVKGFHVSSSEGTAELGKKKALELNSASKTDVPPETLTDCYEAVNLFLNIHGGENDWWQCARIEAEPLYDWIDPVPFYPWDDPALHGVALLRMNEGPHSPVLLGRIDFSLSYAEFYVGIDWAKSRMTLILEDTKTGACNASWEVEIPPQWLAALKTCQYPLVDLNILQFFALVR